MAKKPDLVCSMILDTAHRYWMLYWQNRAEPEVSRFYYSKFEQEAKKAIELCGLRSYLNCL